MKLIPSFGEITLKGKEAFKRFPITLIWAIVGTFFVLSVIEAEPKKLNFYLPAILTFTLGISWLIATRFFIEQFKAEKEWLVLITISLLFVFYWNTPNVEDISIIYWIRFVLYFIAGHLFVFVAPFIFKWQKEAYFNYLQSIFIAIVRSLFFSLILYLGIVLALLAIEHLFNVDVNGKRYFQIFVICLGIVNTWIYLSDFPKDIYNQATINFTKALEVLVKYILIPLVILYLVILYAYSLKILINWNLPKGWVSYLVTALAFLGFVIQVLINPIQKTIKSRTINKFHPWFYILLLPLIALLFVAIFRRISEYGFTENRYFVLVLAFWILVMTTYMLFSKKKQIRYFALTLTILSIIISFGFWGAFDVSSKSQLNRFKKVFTEIKEQSFKIPLKDKNQFESIIQYLNEREILDKVEPVLGYNPVTTFTNASKWQMANKITDSLKIRVTNGINVNEVVLGRTNYFYRINEFNSVFNTKGYDYLKQIRFDSYYNQNNRENTLLDYKFMFRQKENAILVKNKNSIVGIVNLNPLVRQLRVKDDNYKIDPSLMTIEKDLDSLKIKLIFTVLSLSTTEVTKDSLPRINESNAYLLIKKNAK